MGVGVSPHGDVSLRPLSLGKGLAGAVVRTGDAQGGKGQR